MRVEADCRPSAVHVERVPFQENTAEVRLRENVEEVVENGRFTYDEYVLRIPFSPDLQEKIQKNFQDWLATGRIMERMQL